MSARSRRRSPTQAAAQASSPGTRDSEESNEAAAQAIASQAFEGPTSDLPHLEAIEAAFGGRDLGGVQVALGGDADDANDGLGSTGFAMGGKLALRSGADLHTAAHEAAHLFQGAQGVSQAGDSNEQQADAIADRVVAGQSAADLMAGMPRSPGGGSALQLDTGTPDVDAAEDQVDDVQSDLEEGQAKVEDAVETGEEVAETATEVWQVVVPFLKGEKQFREGETVYREPGPVTVMKGRTLLEDDWVEDLLPEVGLFQMYPDFRLGLADVQLTDILVESTSKEDARLKGRLNTVVDGTVGLYGALGPHIQVGKFDVFAGLEGSATASGSSGVSVGMALSQVGGDWQTDAMDLSVQALHVSAAAGLDAVARVAWTSLKGKDRQLEAKKPFPGEGHASADVDVPPLKLQYLRGEGLKLHFDEGKWDVKEQIQALFARMREWFAERRHRLHAEAEAEDHAEAAEG